MDLNQFKIFIHQKEQQYYLIKLQMTENIKREDIILQLGGQFIRVGLVGDKVPRKTMKSGNYLKYPSVSSAQVQRFENGLQELLYNIFFSHINCSCLGKTVIILEKVFTDRRILEVMARIMFKKLKVEKIELALSCVTPLYLTGRYSGIVISAGATTIEIMPVFEGYPIFKCFKSIPLGTLNLNKYLRDQLALLNKQVSLEVLKTITEEDLNEIRTQHGAIGASTNPIAISIKKIRLKLIPDKINYGIFFGNPENEETNIAYAFLSAISDLPSKSFEPVCRNIVLAGGFWRTRGIQKLFKKQLKEQLIKFPNLETRGVKEKLGFVSWSFNPSEVAWIGCSIGASIRSVDHLSLKREEYLKDGFSEKIMKSYFLSS